MFNAKEYWDNRKAGKRGQGEKPKPVFHPKGEEVKYETREGDKSTYPNDQGQNMIMGGRFLSRKEYRTKLPKVKDTTAADKRREARAAKHARRNAGEHERALKKKEGN